MHAVAEVTGTRAGCAPVPTGFFLTSKVIDEVPILHASPLAQRVKEILLAAETDLFHPLLCSARPNEFAQEFALLASKYFPVRLQVLFIILNEIGPERFRTEYFDRVPQLAASLAMHAGDWGLPAGDVVACFGQYFESASQIFKISPYLGLAPAPDLLRLANCMTEIDYGFTAMTLVFEGSIQAQRWRIAEVFRLARRSLLEYEDAANSLVARIKEIQPGQVEMFSIPPPAIRRVAHVHPRALGDAGKHLRKMGQAVEWPADDPDSDYE